MIRRYYPVALYASLIAFAACGSRQLGGRSPSPPDLALRKHEADAMRGDLGQVREEQQRAIERALAACRDAAWRLPPGTCDAQVEAYRAFLRVRQGEK